ncbi:hypothetical protein HY339_01670 [Candidatus Gottesmanbacteria bacterium]|nr:hypothetical protein [Candidatus Gottesmanbacteria bacterium]
MSTTPVFAATNAQDLRAQSAASRAAARREEIKANIQARLDARKQQVVERVQERLSNVNERRTEHFLKVLDRLSAILDKIESRTEKAKAEGKNVTAIETAIASARTAISSAQSAVDAQKGKTYQITVTDDGTAKGEVEAMIKQLHADLKTVYDTIVAARQAVQNVYQQIKTVVGSTKDATPSAVTP